VIYNLLLSLYNLLLEEQDNLGFKTAEITGISPVVGKHIIRLNIDDLINNVILIEYNHRSEIITLWLRHYCPWSQDVIIFELMHPDSIDNILMCIRNAGNVYLN